MVIERMLCVDEFSTTADWSHLDRELNIAPSFLDARLRMREMMTVIGIFCSELQY
jgi:hypothetical protein